MHQVVSSCTALSLCCAVPIEPQNVVVTPVSGSELSVSWTAPDQPPNAPPVLYYTVSWKEEGGEEGSHNISGPANTMYQITGLAQGTQYTVTVTAPNSVGRSDTATGNGTTFSGEWSVCVHVPTVVVAHSVVGVKVLSIGHAASSNMKVCVDMCSFIYYIHTCMYLIYYYLVIYIVML